MRTRVLLFAWAKELAGAAHLEVDTGDDASLAAVRVALLQALTSRLPRAGFHTQEALAARYEACIFAVNDTYVDRSEEAGCALNAALEVALIPPVSGG